MSSYRDAGAGDSAVFSVLGTALHTPARGHIEALNDTLIEVAADGAISAIVPPAAADHGRRRDRARDRGTLFVAGSGQYLLPGLVDTHIHAPQWPQLGKALHLPLEQWLQTHTFPLEARYADSAFAEHMYLSLVDNLLANGTTTALYFATVHQPATRLLADICLAKGQRALIGKVAMDDPDQCPVFYRDASADEALRGTRDFIDYARRLPGNGSQLVRPVITPRFIPSCSDALLRGLGELAAETGCHVQTHCSESDWEHHHVLARCGASDSVSLDRFGLLGRHTVLAHGNLIDDADSALIVERGAGVAHCPLSNAYFSNCVFPLRRALEKQMHVGLGTDISGGPSASMFDACRHAVASSRLLRDGVDPALPADRRGRPDLTPVDFLDTFWLATRGGAELLDLPVGAFRTGLQFDALLIDVNAPTGNVCVFDGLDDLEDVFQKIIYGAARANIVRVWVAGRQVAG